METIGYLDLVALTGFILIGVGGLFAIGAWCEERQRNKQGDK